MANFGRGRWVDGEWHSGLPEEPSEQQKFVDSLTGALKGETVLDDGWVLIGGIKLGTAILVKADDGTPLFDLALRVRPGAVQDYGKNAVYPVILKRNSEGVVEKVLVDFTSEMDMSNQASITFEALIKAGIMKPKK